MGAGHSEDHPDAGVSTAMQAEVSYYGVFDIAEAETQARTLKMVAATFAFIDRAIEIGVTR